MSIKLYVNNTADCYCVIVGKTRFRIIQHNSFKTLYDLFFSIMLGSEFYRES